MYFVHPGSGERYFLRMLLNIIPGAISFQHLRTINGIIYNTFRDACGALGLLQDDKEWDLCLREAGTIKTGAQMRELFATLLLFCEPTYPERLWQKHNTVFTDDILAHARNDANDITLNLSEEDIQNYALNHLQSILQQHGKTLHDFPNMSIPTAQSAPVQRNHIIWEEQSYNTPTLAHLLDYFS